MIAVQPCHAECSEASRYLRVRCFAALSMTGVGWMTRRGLGDTGGMDDTGFAQVDTGGVRHNFTMLRVAMHLGILRVRSFAALRMTQEAR